MIECGMHMYGTMHAFVVCVFHVFSLFFIAGLISVMRMQTLFRPIHGAKNSKQGSLLLGAEQNSLCHGTRCVIIYKTCGKLLWIQSLTPTRLWM